MGDIDEEWREENLENCGGPWSKPVELTPPKEDDWLDTSKACNLDDPECEVCQ